MAVEAPAEAALVPGHQVQLYNEEAVITEHEDGDTIEADGVELKDEMVGGFGDVCLRLRQVMFEK
jgi:succinylarginine dihydrolase